MSRLQLMWHAAKTLMELIKGVCSSWWRWSFLVFNWTYIQCKALHECVPSAGEVVFCRHQHQKSALSVLWISDGSEPDSCSLFCFSSKADGSFLSRSCWSLLGGSGVFSSPSASSPHFTLSHVRSIGNDFVLLSSSRTVGVCRSELPVWSLREFAINDRQSNSSSVSAAARQMWKQASFLHVTSSNPSTRRSLMSLISGAAPALTGGMSNLHVNTTAASVQSPAALTRWRPRLCGLCCVVQLRYFRSKTIEHICCRPGLHQQNFHYDPVLFSGPAAELLLLLESKYHGGRVDRSIMNVCMTLCCRGFFSPT